MTQAADKLWAYVERVELCPQLYPDEIQHAVARFRRDIDRSDWQYTFDWDWLEAIHDFCGLCKHYKGRWAGTAFDPEPWQVFILAGIFCWLDKTTGLRRTRYAYIEVPRKNGKTFLLAVIGLICFIIDDEPGAEIYSAATKRDQAKIVHEDAKKIIRASPVLRDMVTIHRDNLFIDSSSCKFEPVGRNADTLDGLNPHAALIDELHAHPSGEVWGVLETGMGSRSQPLIVATTTAGFNTECFCFRTREMVRNILDPKSEIDDDSWFGFISAAPSNCEWTHGGVWRMANPNFGVSVSEADMKAQCNKAIKLPSEQNQFLCKRLNIWTNQAERFIDMRQWDAIQDDLPAIDELRRMQCFGGLDLSSTTDTTALVLCFRDESGMVYWVPHFWIPDDMARERERSDRIPYRMWADMGLLTMTPGNRIDYGSVRNKVLEMAELYHMTCMGYDPYNATQLMLDLSEKDGLTVHPVSQGIRSISEPTKEVERLVASGKLIHGKHPMMRVHASNLGVKTDENGNVKPQKMSATTRIDGMAAGITAVAVMLTQEPPQPSVYTSRGIIEL